MGKHDQRRESIQASVPGSSQVQAVVHLVDATGGLESTGHYQASDAVGSFIREQGLDPSQHLELEDESWGIVVAATPSSVHFFNTHPDKGTYSHFTEQPLRELEVRYRRVGFPPLRAYRFLFKLSDGRFKVGTSHTGGGLAVHAMNDPKAFIEALGDRAVDMRA